MNTPTLSLLSSTVARYRRAFLARWFPLAVARWVNSQRCQICIWNDPSGRWHVDIGAKHGPQSGHCLGRVMLAAVARLDRDPDWQWSSDFLSILNRQPNPPSIHEHAD